MNLDASFYLLFNSLRTEDFKKEANPKIFQKIVLEKLDEPDLSPNEIINLLAHYILFYREPLANKETVFSQKDLEVRQKMHLCYTTLQFDSSPASLIVHKYLSKHALIS